MSNKPYRLLNELDKIIRKACPVGMDDGVKVTIEFFTGFELFNTRPYHNYETWSGGYRVKGYDVVVVKEDLDDAIEEWVIKVMKKRMDNGD